MVQPPDELVPASPAIHILTNYMPSEEVVGLTALSILAGLLETRRVLTSTMIKDAVISHGYSLKTAYYVIQEAVDMGWMTRIRRVKRGVMVYKSNLYGGSVNGARQAVGNS